MSQSNTWLFGHHAVKAALKSAPRKTFEILATKQHEDEYKDLDIHDRLARSFACRSAIMKGDKLTPEEMYRLIDDLFATNFPDYCPHGRPTIVDLDLKELNARFLR